MEIFVAKAIHTMDPSCPTAEAVAVADSRVVGLGSVEELRRLGRGADVTVIDTFANKVLLPGFIEAHSHSFEGSLWQFTYCGYFGRTDPSGRYWPGCTSVDEVIERLAEAEAELQGSEPLLAWGMDPIYFPGDRLVARHLDAVSETRPIFVLHASIHLATVNTALMEKEGIGPQTTMEGVPKDAEGQPIGELQEPAAMSLARETFSAFFRALGNDDGIRNFGALARNAGITTLTDLGTRQLDSDSMVEQWQRIVNDPSFPARVSMFHNPGMAGGVEIGDSPEMLLKRRSESTDKLRMGHVKLILDGSIQGLTARLRWPGYLDGQPNGLWLIPPDQVAERLAAFHNAGLLVHAHCNGDEAVDVFLDAVEHVLEQHPRTDHRHTVQHCQLTSPGQYRRMRELGLCANIFANHTFYWGDQHVSVTVGLDRASRMNSARTALQAGVPLSMHSDAAVTPLGSLHVAWCAVNRLTASGRVLGENERISVHEAMYAITMGAAYQLKMDDEIGSISPRKFADFAVLEDDPFTVDPTELKDVRVWGTVLGGDVHQAG